MEGQGRSKKEGHDGGRTGEGMTKKGTVEQGMTGNGTVSVEVYGGFLWSSWTIGWLIR